MNSVGRSVALDGGSPGSSQDETDDVESARPDFLPMFPWYARQDLSASAPTRHEQYDRPPASAPLSIVTTIRRRNRHLPAAEHAPAAVTELRLEHLRYSGTSADMAKTMFGLAGELLEHSIHEQSPPATLLRRSHCWCSATLKVCVLHRSQPEGIPRSIRHAHHAGDGFTNMMNFACWCLPISFHAGRSGRRCAGCVCHQ